MVRSKFVLLIMASWVVLVNEPVNAKEIKTNMFGEGSKHRVKNRFHYEISKARKAAEKVNDDAAAILVKGLKEFSDAHIDMYVNISQAAANVVRFIRENPSHMSAIIANLPKVMTSYGIHSLNGPMLVLTKHAARHDQVLIDSFEIITNALGDVTPGDNNHPGRTTENNSPRGSSNLFGGISGSFRNLMDSTYVVLRPYDSNYNRRDNYH